MRVCQLRAKALPLPALGGARSARRLCSYRRSGLATNCAWPTLYQSVLTRQLIASPLRRLPTRLQGPTVDRPLEPRLTIVSSGKLLLVLVG